MCVICEGAGLSKKLPRDTAEREMAKRALQKMLWDPEEVLKLVDLGAPVEILAVLAIGLGPPSTMQ